MIKYDFQYDLKYAVLTTSQVYRSQNIAILIFAKDCPSAQQQGYPFLYPLMASVYRAFAVSEYLGTDTALEVLLSTVGEG